MAFNKVILLGNLTADPETRTTPNGQSLASFSIAVNRSYVDRDGNRQDQTDFINCTAWGKTGETISKFFTKGRQILVEGRLQQRSWDDKDTGKKRSAIDVVVETFSFVNDGKGAGADGGGSTRSSSKSSAVDDAPADDIDEPIDLSDIPF